MTEDTAPIGVGQFTCFFSLIHRAKLYKIDEERLSCQPKNKVLWEAVSLFGLAVDYS